MTSTTSALYPRVHLKEMDAAGLVLELVNASRVLPFGDDASHARLLEAATAATYLHRNQTRMVRENFPRVPYIEHPLRNALRLLRWGVKDYDLLAAALLHDTVEDCASDIVRDYVHGGHEIPSTDPIELRAEALAWLTDAFGPRVADIVAAVSNPFDGTSYEEHMTHMASDPVENTEALLVKAADLIDNAGSLAHQFGSVSDAFIARMMRKYEPTVALVASALREIELDRHDMADAIESLELVSSQLIALKSRLKS